ncbi:Peptidoglycan/LPS O-acetylase OafA/YrhL, contains acyltransferase and SGNH-hydrolase domains [Mycolicibacterium rutilum]|uniref:Peptidoglycan/LPS O-acetylase OafA/YrhL, contains acyltransferase and SGNH-hydrolase domains n=1 Tax=Mycolicibacterium rutilum TaxID=370526 RepID=A0A1H6L042_MYCRU|nr:acyltransferase [Mycolicibacterium rutilum]SEH77448.1 Peptidoglycan/LPS O-acetylase OafA/YrhL, contains acyltransferase and SGNH-hydrolase domains [Mycolicibacterium rutilum]
MRTGEIKALSGLRIVAAIWVVLFHFRPLLEQSVPGFRSALAPVLNCGAQGVDLFFMLSGFVLTWNYLDRMGPSFDWKATLRFLWLRLARVWPVYLVTMHLAALWIIFTLHVGHIPSEAAESLTAMNYLRQALMIQLWFVPYFDGSSWDGPAWSISAEWLAYLLFGALILVIFRINRSTRARGLIVLAFVATLPPIMLLLATGLFYTPWSWLPRIVMQFTAGALVCAAVRKLNPGDKARRVAGYAAVLIGATIVAILYWLDAHPVPKVLDSAGLVDILFVPLLLTLAIGTGSLPWLLALRPVVYLGHVSFSLYMVHELVHTSWNWMVLQFELSLRPDLAGKLIMVALLGVALIGAVVLYHFVEEPARKWMRSMMSARGDSSPNSGQGRLASLHDAKDERAQVVSARAG